MVVLKAANHAGGVNGFDEAIVLIKFAGAALARFGDSFSYEPNCGRLPFV